MTDLRTALHDYTTADEPPMRLTAGDVIAAAKGTRHGRRPIIVFGGIAATVAAVVGALIAVPAMLTSPGPDSTPVPAIDKCLDAQNDNTATRKCVVTELLAAELPGARIGQMNLEDLGGNQPWGYRVDTQVTNPAGSVHLEVVWGPKNTKGANRCTGRPDCTERTGPHGEEIIVTTMPDQAFPEGKALFVIAATPKAHLQIYTIEQDRTKRLLDTEALIRIATTPQLFP